MVEPSCHIDLPSLTLDELTGVVNLYPWFSAARMELCRRMFAMGENAWSPEEFGAQALYMADRSKFSDLVRGRRQIDCSDRDVEELLASFLEPAAPAAEAEETHRVRVVGGDYFSQAQYDNVKEGGDNIFSRFAFKSSSTAGEESDTSDIAEHFATETLARIFAEQGRIEEARRIYSRLILEFPEKSAYFASLIDSLT